MKLVIHYGNLPPRAPFIDIVLAVILNKVYENDFLLWSSITWVILMWLGFICQLAKVKMIDIFEPVGQKKEDND